MAEPRNLDAAKVLPIIGLPLTLGPLLFLGVALYLRHFTDFGKPAPEPFLTWISLPVAAAALMAAFLIPRPKNATPDRVRGHFIMRMAIVEGGALFAGAAYLLEGQPYSLMAAVGCISFMAALLMPTPNRVRD